MVSHCWWCLSVAIQQGLLIIWLTPHGSMILIMMIGFSTIPYPVVVVVWSPFCLLLLDTIWIYFCFDCFSKTKDNFDTEYCMCVCGTTNPKQPIHVFYKIMIYCIVENTHMHTNTNTYTTFRHTFCCSKKKKEVHTTMCTSFWYSSTYYCTVPYNVPIVQVYCTTVVQCNVCVLVTVLACELFCCGTWIHVHRVQCIVWLPTRTVGNKNKKHTNTISRFSICFHRVDIVTADMHAYIVTADMRWHNVMTLSLLKLKL